MIQFTSGASAGFLGKLRTKTVSSCRQLPKPVSCFYAGDGRFSHQKDAGNRQRYQRSNMKNGTYPSGRPGMGQKRG